jgi:hypothetical protein
VLAAEHLPRLGRLHLLLQLGERADEIGLDRLALLRPLEEHGQIVDATRERSRELPVFLQARAALEQALGGLLVVPEVGRGYLLLDPRELLVQAGDVKDSSADRRRGRPDPDSVERARRVESS